MKKVNKKLKDFIEDCAQKSTWIIGVSNYKIDVYYMVEDDKEDDEHIVYASMTTDRRYLSGKLKIFPALVKEWKKGEKNFVKETIFHEISHLVTQHVYDLIISCFKDERESKDALENLTEIISRMALKIDTHEQKGNKT